MKQPHDRDTLAGVLKMFYIGARKENGSAYSKSSLDNIRFDLNRYFLATRHININDPAFREANKVFSAKMCGAYTTRSRQSCQLKVEHKKHVVLLFILYICFL